jgi:hypothetical protein
MESIQLLVGSFIIFADQSETVFEFYLTESSYVELILRRILIFE